MSTSTAPSHHAEEKSGQPASEKVDTRGMAAPANILLILNKAAALPPGKTLDVQLDTLPMQLYDLLSQRGFLLIASRQKDGTVSGQVRPRENSH